MSTSNAGRLVGALLVLSLVAAGCASGSAKPAPGGKPVAAAKPDAAKPAPAAKPGDAKAAADKAAADKAAAEKAAADKAAADKAAAAKAAADKAAADKAAADKAAAEKAAADQRKADEARRAAEASKQPMRAAGALSKEDEAKLSELSADAKRRDEYKKFLVQKYIEMGDELYAVGEWEKARSKYSDVLELDSGNAHATRRIEEIGGHLNERGGSAGSTFANAIEEAKVKREQAKMTVAELTRSAQAAEQARKFDEAIASYQKALVIVEIQPFSVDFTPNADALRAMIASAKDRRGRAEQERRTKEFTEAQRIKEAQAARERAAQRATIQTLFRDATAAMDQERYQTAATLAEQILSIDPTNKQAQELRRIALRAGNSQYESSVRSALREQWKTAFEELQKEVVPQTELVKFPETWNTLEGIRNAPLFSSAAAFQEDPSVVAIRAKIEAVKTPLNVSNDQTRIQDLLQWLSDLTGVNIVLDGKARTGKSDQDLMVQQYTLSSPVSVKEILDLITVNKGLGWTIDHGVVLVTTQDQVRGAAILDLYDVKDITFGILDFPADDINLEASGKGGFNLPVEEGNEPKKPIEGDKIKDLITNNIDKEIWGNNGCGVDFKEPGTLVVKAPVTTHNKVRKLLADLRNTGGMQVSIETRFITVADNFLQDVGVDLRGLGDDSLGTGVAGKGTKATFDDVLFGNPSTPGGIGTGTSAGVFYNFIHGAQDLRARVENLYDTALGKPGVLLPSGGTSVQATYLDDTQVEAILRAVEKSERSTQVIAPRVTAYNAQRANVQVLNQVSYIGDYDVEIAQLSQIGDPIVMQLRDGIILDIRPVISADRRFITMELRPTVALLQRPIQTFQTTLSNGPPVSIQLPEIRVQRVRTTVTVPDGGTLLLGGLRFYEEQRLDSSVPFLSDIPILSFFWSRKGTFIERRNLFILLKATILRLEEQEPSLGRRG
jgi:type II secretory pathway component GspD/PulD (secretin)